ncbi:MAG TPA: zinc-dependent metalloprotease, partial [Acidimicrobiales bacterium]|nr:zinc-dependent metalloprotease [Acidimicrobiales bacterium]
MNDPTGGGNPLEGLLGDLLKMIGTQAGATPWLDAAKALAHNVATDGAPEANADPLQRIALEELARVAELHVSEATGLPVGTDGQPATFVPVGRGAWALRCLEAWGPLIEKTVAAQRAGGAGPGPS